MALPWCGFFMGVSVALADEVLAMEAVDLLNSDDSVSLLQTHARRGSPLNVSFSEAGKFPTGSVADPGNLFAGANRRTVGYMSSSMMSDSAMRGLERREAPEVAAGTWSFDVPHSVKIVSWTGQFAMDKSVLQKVAPRCTFEELPHSDKDITYIRGHKACCDWEFVISDPETDISDADVVMFYLPYVQRTDWRKSMPSTKKPGQMWIATCGEPMSRPETGMDCSLAMDKDFMEQIDGLASFQDWAEFPVFNDPPNEELMRWPLPDFAVRGQELATMAISDCAGGERAEWLNALLNELEKRGRGDAVLSYGFCRHNAEEPTHECPEHTKWFDGWSNRCASRPFKFVGENEIEPWYITEKIWDAYWEGAIPVYWGPDEVKQLVPPESMIFWRDYESPSALVDALLAFTEADFQRMTAWKTKPVSEWGNYTEARRLSHATLLPRLCEAAAKSKGA